MSIADKLDRLSTVRTNVRSALVAKGVTAAATHNLEDFAGDIAAIPTDPTIPVGTGQHLVTFYDFDGKVLKRQRVATGGDATAPATPTHQFLTFAEWNNPYTNVQSDIDTGAIYNTTDGKTYLFITLTAVTGLAPTLYFSKSSTSLMTIDWGDGTTSTSTNSGNQNINHVYASAGDYVITVDNSYGGTWQIGHGTSTTAILADGNYSKALTMVYFGNNLSNLVIGSIGYNYKSLRYISTGNYFSNFGNAGLIACLYEALILPKTCLSADSNAQSNSSLRVIVHGYGNTTTFKSLYACSALRKIIFPSTITSISANCFANCFYMNYYIFLSPTPPTLANVNAFTGINTICKIYVPDASVDAYKAATNWVTYANYIYPLSQKPQSNE